MTDRPIIFSAPMVRSLLEGKKTQTRRVLKPQPYDTGECYAMHIGGRTWRLGVLARAAVGDDWTVPYDLGDRLWVRETWARWLTPELFGGPPQRITEYRAGREMLAPRYAGDYDIDNWKQVISEARKPDSVPWKSPIHMPRKLSRLTLIVTDVRVQRLAEMTEQDAEAEGWPAPEDRAKTGIAEIRDAYPTSWFAHQWDSINGRKPGCAWADNPWIVALSFDTYHQNIDQMPQEKAA